MAHFARIDENNKVVETIVISNEDMLDENGNEVEALGVEVCERCVGPGRWVQTSYSGKFRGNYGGPGSTYDPEADIFIHDKPFPSAVLSPDYKWIPPIPKPSDGKNYTWLEDEQEWVEVAPSNPVLPQQ